jgi:hypothetical protein
MFSPIILGQSAAGTLDSRSHPRHRMRSRQNEIAAPPTSLPEAPDDNALLEAVASQIFLCTRRRSSRHGGRRCVCKDALQGGGGGKAQQPRNSDPYRVTALSTSRMGRKACGCVELPSGTAAVLGTSRHSYAAAVPSGSVRQF